MRAFCFKKKGKEASYLGNRYSCLLIIYLIHSFMLFAQLV